MKKDKPNLQTMLSLVDRHRVKLTQPRRAFRGQALSSRVLDAIAAGKPVVAMRVFGWHDQTLEVGQVVPEAEEYKTRLAQLAELGWIVPLDEYETLQRQNEVRAILDQLDTPRQALTSLQTERTKALQRLSTAQRVLDDLKTDLEAIESALHGKESELTAQLEAIDFQALVA